MGFAGYRFGGMNRIAALSLILSVLMLGMLAPAHADFPDVVPFASVDSVAKQYECDVEQIGAPFQTLLLTPKAERHNVDSKYHQTYRAACHVYVPSASAPEFEQRFLVMAPTSDDKQFMIRTARLLALLWRLEKKHLKHDHLEDLPTVQVWLTANKAAGLEGDVGGEQFKNQIYLYDLHHEREPVEWLREIAHEYGHYALPGVSGFTFPEEWGNGVLGERIHIAWLLEAINAGDLKPTDLPFVTPAELATYFSNHAKRPLDAILSTTPFRSDYARKDAFAIDRFTGLALYIDRTYGSAQLLSAMATMHPGSPDRFVEALDFYDGVLSSLRDTVKLTATFDLAPGATGAVVVYLPAGSYLLTPMNELASWNIRLLPPGSKKTNTDALVISRPNWYLLQYSVKPTAGGTVHLQIIKTGGL